MSYQLLDAGEFEKLEQVGPFKIIRPSPSAVWKRSLEPSQWKGVDAHFKRFTEGDGEWKIFNPEIKDPWAISVGPVKFVLKLTGFGHLGIFPEQEDNWRELSDVIQKFKHKRPEKPFRLLNLFAYTGGTSLFAAHAGAEVTHVDASKTSVTWGRENAEVSGLSKKPIRWLVDDVKEFIKREVRRGSKYEGIVLDPPSYGRGPKKQLWKIETHLLELLEELQALKSEDFCLYLLSSHSPGYTPQALENILKSSADLQDGSFNSQEMLVHAEGGLSLPSGASSLWSRYTNPRK